MYRHLICLHFLFLQNLHHICLFFRISTQALLVNNHPKLNARAYVNRSAISAAILPRDFVVALYIC
ncbi:hypothetical protein KC19_12G110600 [Ceratodon purpureus]|uniref:Secreted protein n=1 Tax=Ceratodon purpureus TaxID=3225 RepID=A0A8T0G5X8_CERPU|nr:hypothetical protein KC19_12G110600 [Ceratodon purpureus]